MGIHKAFSTVLFLLASCVKKKPPNKFVSEAFLSGVNYAVRDIRSA